MKIRGVGGSKFHQYLPPSIFFNGIALTNLSLIKEDQYSQTIQFLYPYFRGHKDKIFVIKWNPHEANKIVTVGVKHIKFWTQTGGGFTSVRGTFGNVSSLDTMMCVTFGRTADVCFTGGGNGSIYIWQGQSLSKAIKAHEGPLFAMHSLDKVSNLWRLHLYFC